MQSPVTLGREIHSCKTSQPYGKPCKNSDYIDMVVIFY